MMTAAVSTEIALLPTPRLLSNPFSVSVYGDPAAETDGLLDSVRRHGVLVPLVVTPVGDDWEVLSGHRRLACAHALELDQVPCQIMPTLGPSARRRIVLEYNRQRRKTFSQQMREADALESILAEDARRRQRANLRPAEPERRNSDARHGRTDVAVAAAIGLGSKDLYRQARAIWRHAEQKDARATAVVPLLDAGTKTINSAYKDLRRRDRFAAGFRPTPYDVWPFKHDRAFGIPHPGSIPAAIIAHLLHYYTKPGDLVVDPMAGGGTTVDVANSMGRRILAYDIAPLRPEIAYSDVKLGFTPEARGCALIFCDPPYHTMKARLYQASGVGELCLGDWIAFLHQFAVEAFETLAPGGHVALLLANQTERDLPPGAGYIDHAFLGYQSLQAAGFQPERRVSCPMDGGHLPQHIQRARRDGRMLGQVRDLLIMRKPQPNGSPPASS